MNTPRDLETVTIEPNGRWSVKASNDDKPTSSNGAHFEDNYDDDELEISEISVISRRLDTPKTYTPRISTPMSGGRDSSASAPRGLATTSTKRQASAVIDLTLDSDDEEDPIERPHKRQNTSTNGFGDASRMGFLSESPLGYPN